MVTDRWRVGATALLAAGGFLALAGQPPPYPSGTDAGARGSPQAAGARGAADFERRLRSIEEKLDRLLEGWSAAWASAGPTSTGSGAQPPDEEGRRGAAIWARLTRDGFLGRNDCDDTSPDRLATAL